MKYENSKLGYKILEMVNLYFQEVKTKKDMDLWIPIFREWYKKDGSPMNSKEIRELRIKELDLLEVSP